MGGGVIASFGELFARYKFVNISKFAAFYGFRLDLEMAISTKLSIKKDYFLRILSANFV